MSTIPIKEKCARTDVLQEQLRRHGLVLDTDEYVRWHRDSSYHPRNWSWKRKAYDVGFIIVLELFTLQFSEQARYDYGISQRMGYFSFTSTTLLGEGLGGMFLPPVSETFGRKALYSSATFCLGICSFITAAVPARIRGSFAAVIAGRFLMGVVASTPGTVAPGSFEDIYTPEELIWSVFAWNTASNIGAVLGPIYSAYVTSAFGWRWVFFITGIVSGIAFLFSFGLRESRPSLLLQRKLVLLHRETGDMTLRIQNPDKVITMRLWLQQTLVRPLRLMFSEPIIILCSVLIAIPFALICGLTKAVTVVYSSLGFSTTTSSLAFLPMLVGVLVSVVPRVYDQRRFNHLRLQNIPITPEVKIQSFAVAVPALAIGLWWFVWTVPPAVNISWVVSMLALVPIGYATNDLNTVLTGYLVDSYTMYAASAFSAHALVRALLAAAFPLFVGTMFDGLGANIAASILAAVATLFCISPLVLLRYGVYLRGKSAFAKYSLELSQQSFA